MAATPTRYCGLFAKPNLDEVQTIYGKTTHGATELTPIATISIRNFLDLNFSSSRSKKTIHFEQYNASFLKENFSLYLIDDDKKSISATVNGQEVGRINLFNKKGDRKEMEAIEAELLPFGENELALFDPMLNAEETDTTPPRDGSRPPSDAELAESGSRLTDRQEELSEAQPSTPSRHRRRDSFSSTRGRQPEQGERQQRSSSVGTKPQPDVSSLFADAEGGDEFPIHLIDLTNSRVPNRKGFQPSISDLGKGLANLPPEEAILPLKGRSALSYTLFVGLAGVALIVSTGVLARALPFNQATLQVWKSPAA